ARLKLPLPAHAAQAAAAPLQFKEFSGHAEFDAAAVTLARSRITTAGSIYRVSGTVRYDRRLALTMASSSARYDLAGTLDAPVLAIAAERAAAPAVIVPSAAPPAPAPVKAGPGGER
ncbi:MAG TPA: hypothetical protein VE998_05310, partial [Terriglobales bacterium]|nr:hypothetical protein [Terriglobales bacterium]